MNYLRPDLLDRLAAGFALGTMSRRAARRFAAVMQDSRQARSAVDGWHGHLNSLATSIPTVLPRAEVWQQIVRRTTSPSPASPRETTARRWWWPALGTLAGALLVVAAVRLEPRWLGVEPTSTVALAPSYVGLLTTSADQPAALVSSLRHGRTMTVKMLRPLVPPPGQVATLWALPEGGNPFPLGTLPANGKAVIALPDTSERLFVRVPRLAVSFELTPAAADARPSGPFVLSGHCVKLW